MNRNKIEQYIKVQEFLEDIYIYLNNNVTQSNEIEHQKLDEKRKELIENCKHIRSIFELEFHPHDDVESSSYLDMNGASMNRNHGLSLDGKHENDLLKEDYINMTMRDVPENAYDIYETTTSLKNENSEQCPYTGLPAAHLKIMNSIQSGLLTRIEKKLFFAQSKDFYVGILEKWILLYPSKSNDMKPSECFYPKTIKVNKGENQFIVVTNLMKRYHFQAPNAKEFNDWVKNIQCIVDQNRKTEIADLCEMQTNQLSFRKLPSPPQDETFDSRSSSENYYGFNRSSNQTVINNDERLYEEPRASSSHPIETFTNNIEENNEQPPDLPEKTGKKIRDAEIEKIHSYDVPKPAKSILSLDEESKLQDDCESSISELGTTNETPSKTKVSEITAILSTINLVSPEEKRKSTHNPSFKKIATPDKIEPEKSDKRISPMKNWISKHINKSKKRLSKREKSPMVEDESSDIPTILKGSNVTNIINQLEKNGQLKVLSKSLKNRKSSAFSDGEEYETVCVRN